MRVLKTLFLRSLRKIGTMQGSSPSLNLQHLQLVARHVRADIDRVSLQLAARGAQLSASEIYLGLAEVVLRVFIDHEGFDEEKLGKFCELFKEELGKGMAKAKTRHSFHN